MPQLSLTRAELLAVLFLIEDTIETSAEADLATNELSAYNKLRDAFNALDEGPSE